MTLESKLFFRKIEKPVKEKTLMLAYSGPLVRLRSWLKELKEVQKREEV